MFGSDSAITVGRIAGAPVRIGPGSVLVAAYIAYALSTRWVDQASTAAALAVGAVTGLGFMASILAHEAGHALVARRAGIRSREIRLSLFGGVAALERGAPTPGGEMKVAAAGPIVNLVIGAVALLGVLALGSNDPGLTDSIAVEAVVWLGAINLILAGFNLLPGLPLDGGRVLTGFLWWRRDDRVSAVRTTAAVGKFLGYAAFAFAGYELFVLQRGFGLYTAFIGFLLTRGADGELARAQLVDRLRGRRIGEVARFQPPVIRDDVNTASARALLPGPGTTRWSVVVDDAGIARGLLDLAVLDRAATIDGTDPVGDVMVPVDQHRAAYVDESLDEVIERGAMVPLVVIDREWRPVGLVDSLVLPPPTVPA